jgi:hypothetical protein
MQPYDEQEQITEKDKEQSEEASEHPQTCMECNEEVDDLVNITDHCDHSLCIECFNKGIKEPII